MGAAERLPDSFHAARPNRTQLDKGITPKAGYVHYTVRQAAQDWLATGLDGRSAKTIKKNQNVLEPILKVIGARKLRDLTAADVRRALAVMAAGYSTAAVSMGHLALQRAIRHAEANDLVSRNVAALADTPTWRRDAHHHKGERVAAIVSEPTLAMAQLLAVLLTSELAASALPTVLLTAFPGRVPSQMMN
jgi:hypothetical protein